MEDKLSTKEYVRQRLAELHAEPTENTLVEQEERKGPGRPRKYPVGYKKPYESRLNLDDPVSVARSKAAKIGVESRQKKEQSEYWRKRKGHEQQEILDQAIVNLNQELETYNCGHSLDKQDTKEFAAICVTIIQDCIWQRQCPIDSDNFYDEIELDIEDKKFCCGWIDRYMHDVLVMASYTLHPDRPLLQKLAVETAEKFLLWAKTQKSPDVQVAATETRALLGQLQNGKIYKGLILPDPRLIRPEPLKTKEEQIAEYQEQYRRWEHQGRDANAMLSRAESLQEAKLRLDRELEAAIIEQKAEQERHALEAQQRALLGSQYDDIQRHLHGGDDIFGSTPRPR